MAFSLKDHQIWHDYSEVLAQLNLNMLVRKHLEDCNYKVIGYQDEDEPYDEIELGMSGNQPDISRWVTLNFLLKAANSHSEEKSIMDDEIKEIGELTLVFDSNLQCIDESWLIYTESPFVIAKHYKDLTQELSPA
jgi:hypothetical protein